MAALQVDNDYGYVIFVFVASVGFVLQWMGIKVGMARKQYGVKYPKMYIEPFGHVFNCIQRVHQNTLEGYPVFLALLFLGGLVYPRVSAVAGLLYIAGRIVYALGYYTGDPEKRTRGSFGYIGLITLLVNTIILGLRMLGILSA